MVKVKEERIDQLEIRYREDSPEIDNNVQYSQVGSISDQVRAIWGEEEVEVKPKIEPIEIDPNRQLVIKLDRDFLRKNYRTKWIDHVLSTYCHRNLMKACQVCVFKNFFDSPSKLIEHYKEFHQEETTWYECAICFFSTKYQKLIMRHWENSHQHGRKHPIPIKGKYRYRLKPSTAEKYTVSRRANDPKNKWIGDDELVHSMFYNEPFECDICFKTFKKREFFEKHKIMYHLEENEIKKWYKCDQCNKRFRVKQSLKIHLKFNHKEKLSCVFCSKQYAHLSQLRQHELTHRNEMLTCEFCDMKFIDKGAQLIHYRKLHFVQLRQQDKLNGRLNKWFQGRRTYECYRCSFTKDYHRVKEHMEKCKFDGKNAIECAEENCIRRFEKTQQMKRHYKLTHDKKLDLMNVPHKRRTYECYICRQPLNSFHLIRRHLTKEHPEKNTCNICNATFPTWCGLKRHKLIHGEKTFICTYCPMRAFLKSNIKKHEKVHTKPIKCERCDFRCAYKDSLMVHIKNGCTGRRSKKSKQ